MDNLYFISIFSLLLLLLAVVAAVVAFVIGVFFVVVANDKRTGKVFNINVIRREDLVQGHNLCKYGH